MRALALLVLAGGWAATLWLAPFSDERVNDLFVYRVFAAPVLDGSLPYRDVFFEYPPLAAPAIALPGLVGTEAGVFRAAFAGWTLLLAAVVVLVCGALAARSGGDRRRALLAAALMPVLCGASIRTHFDLAPVALLLVALLLLLDGRSRTGMAVLGLAVMTKGFPLAVVPVALVWLGWHADRRTVVQSAAALLAALAIPAVAMLALSPTGAWNALEYHLERPVQVESLPATAINALDPLGAGEAEPVSSHRSDGLEHPAADALAAVALVVMLAVVALVAARSARPPPAGPDAARQLVLGSLAAVLAFTAFAKVLSPQFMLWLVPLGALAFAWRLHSLVALIAAAVVLTQIEFPVRYFDLVERDPFPLALVAVRNAVLLAALGLALRALSAGRHQHLLDGHRASGAVPLDDDRVEPRVLV